MCEERRNCTVCVTGAGGFIASWLIKGLLLRGYNVNGTVLDPGNERETAHILSLPGAKERLRLFKADLLENGSFETAVQGCEFVILLATSMDFTVDAEAQTAVVEGEVKATLDILKACAKIKSVRRVIYTSSINAASPLNDNGEFRDCVDESCWTPVDLIRREKPLFWMYYVAKALSEQAALQYGSDHGIEVVTIAPALVSGPSLTPTLPSSIDETLGLITGRQECYEWLKEFQWLMGSIALVHVDDLCDAYIFLMEHQSAKGRFICCAQDLSLKELWDFCNKRYSQFCPPLQYPKEDDFLNHVPVSSKRLLDLGFSYKENPQRKSLKEMVKKGKAVISKKSEMTPLFMDTTCNREGGTSTWEAMYNILEEEQPRIFETKVIVDRRDSSYASMFDTTCSFLHHIATCLFWEVLVSTDI